jgi:ribonuclease P protein component
MVNSKPYSLDKSGRLKSRKQIDILFESGRKMTQFPFRLLFRTGQEAGEMRAGFTVSSKNFPRAVDRNRIKRLIREAYRLQKKELEAGVTKNRTGLHLFFIYTAREIISYEEISLRLKQLLDKLVRLINEEPVANT